MSTFTDYETYLIPLGSTVSFVHNTWKTILTDSVKNNWQVHGEQTTTYPYLLQVYPPADEVIGNSQAYDFLEIATNTTTVTFTARRHYTTGWPQVIAAYTATAGVSTISITINGSIVSYTGTITNSATDNLLGLYNAIQTSIDTNFTNYSWDISYPSPTNADDINIEIEGISKIARTQDTFTGTNITAITVTVPIPVNSDVDSFYSSPSAGPLTIDLDHGFVYFIQVSKRGIALATKTNTNYFGPLHATWNRSGVGTEYLPNSPLCNPIELFVGYDEGQTSAISYAYSSCAWGISQYLYNYSDGIHSAYSLIYPSSGNPNSTAVGILRDRISDVVANIGRWSNPGWNTGTQLLSSSMWDNNYIAVANDFQVHRMGSQGYSGRNVANNNWYAAPPIITDDWYKFIGTATNEALLLIADTVAITTLTAGTAVGATTIPVADLSAFQTPSDSGHPLNAIIGIEIISYTGKSASSGSGNLTGVSKGLYGTSDVAHYMAESVSQGLWFTVINGGALLCGYSKPA